jgi:hypothetical protein
MSTLTFISDDMNKTPKGPQRHQGAWETGHYEFELKNTPKAERTKALLAHMTSGREPGKRQRTAVSQMIDTVLSVWLDQTSSNQQMMVPNRITMDHLVEQAGWERGLDLGNGSSWQLWKGDQMAATALIDGEGYGLIPKEIRICGSR